ncbi:hypothetical protein M2T55_36265, partial [Klebsiella pneumoniae]|nr:hypothetical protein [Klebsiella pneumoniae]
PSNKKMHIMRDGKRRIVGVDNVVDEEEYNQNLHVRPHIDLDDDLQEPVAYAHLDHMEGITLRPMHLYSSIIMNEVFFLLQRLDMCSHLYG